MLMATKKTQKPKAEHLKWTEINSILGQLAGQVHATFTYLPPEHPESFCQSLAVAGRALERLAHEAGQMALRPPKGRHIHR
jgi:hypothetical protein